MLIIHLTTKVRGTALTDSMFDLNANTRDEDSILKRFHVKINFNTLTILSLKSWTQSEKKQGALASQWLVNKKVGYRMEEGVASHSKGSDGGNSHHFSLLTLHHWKAVPFSREFQLIFQNRFLRGMKGLQGEEMINIGVTECGSRFHTATWPMCLIVILMLGSSPSLPPSHCSTQKSVPEGKLRNRYKKKRIVYSANAG